MAKKSFILNDEREKNSYGFYVPNNKILLTRFKKNGVMLYMHKRGEVCGRWENIRIEDHLLLADPVFDVAIERYAEIAGQVERGFLNGASLYLNFNSETKFVEVDGRLELHDSEAFEGSIVDIPSNSGSLKLFAEGKELADEEIKSIMLSASPLATLNPKIKIKKQMSNLKLSAKAITALALAGVTAGDTEESISQAIQEMGAALSAEITSHGIEKAERERLQGIIKAQESVQLNALLAQAVTDGQILGDQKETFAALGFDGAKKIIEGLPKKVTLAGQLSNTGGGAGGNTDPKTKEEFFALSTEQQVAFKNSNESAYKALFA